MLGRDDQDNGTDVLIIGAGIAGLSAAIKLATHFPESRITLISKDRPGESNTIIHSMLSKLESLQNVRLLWQTLAVDLLIEGSGESRVCKGISYLRAQDSRVRIMQASFIVLATGGIGQVYPLTTNPSIATGDGIAMAYRAGASIANMAFVQFHPTVLNVQTDDVAFLISEALRGFGAHLISVNDNRFMFDYDTRGELAPRDIVSRAIYVELVTVGMLILRQALEQTRNRGTHYNCDLGEIEKKKKALTIL